MIKRILFLFKVELIFLKLSNYYSRWVLDGNQEKPFLGNLSKKEFWKGGDKGELVEMMNWLKHRFIKEKQELREVRPSCSPWHKICRGSHLIPFPLAPGSIASELYTPLWLSNHLPPCLELWATSSRTDELVPAWSSLLTYLYHRCPIVQDRGSAYAHLGDPQIRRVVNEPNGKFPIQLHGVNQTSWVGRAFLTSNQKSTISTDLRHEKVASAST